MPRTKPDTGTAHTLAERVQKFQCMELPGQPMMMHMGTSYLVGDLWRSHQELLSALRQMVLNSEGDGKTYRDCHKKAVAAIEHAEGGAK